ncbi:MAG TPA: hypothetical protein VHX87_07460 [Galbitalea sp.]|jgi:hypothetical protein|nr:hypothetical protein [Galbitalea sp.]
MSDPTPVDAEGTGVPEKPVFTKEAQPDLPLALRREKAGWNKNRIATWIVVGGFALFMIIEGLVGILTKSR